MKDINYKKKILHGNHPRCKVNDYKYNDPRCKVNDH